MSDPRPSYPPDAAVREHLLETLRELERDPSGNEPYRKQLRGWLASRMETSPGAHMEVHELRKLAERRRREGYHFQLPEHLLECRVCMELFQVLCEDKADLAAAPGATQHGQITDTHTDSEAQKIGMRRKPVLSLAASFLLGLLLWAYLRPPGIILESGALLAATETLQGGPLPARSHLESLRQTRLRFLDGSSITLEPGANIRIGRDARFHPFILLSSGEALFDFRDARAAPHLRSGELRILPANAEFQLITTDAVQTLTVHRGVLQIRHGSETRRVSEGETLAFE